MSTEFLNVFEPIICTKSLIEVSGIRFPFDIVAPGTDKPVGFTIGESGGPIILSSDQLQEEEYGDTLSVPLYETVGETLEEVWRKMNEDAMRLVVHVGIHRNVLAFDPDALPGHFTQDLADDLERIMRRCGNGRPKLTDLYLDRMALVRFHGIDLGEVNIHPIDSDLWEKANDYYTSLNGLYHEGKGNLVIGVSNDRNDCFVRVLEAGNHEITRDPLKGEYAVSCGIGAMDARHVLLGVI